MDDLVNLLNKLSIDNDATKELDSLCDKISSIKITEEKEEVKQELIKKEVFNFFEILKKKGRCIAPISDINIRWLY